MTAFSGRFDSEGWYRTWKDGETFSPSRSLKIRNHSPTGFAWGYCGSGPAQLALAILLEVTDEATAELLYQEFKNSVIAALPQEENSTWELTYDEVQQWLNENRTLLEGRR